MLVIKIECYKNDHAAAITFILRFSSYLVLVPMVLPHFICALIVLSFVPSPCAPLFICVNKLINCLAASQQQRQQQRQRERTKINKQNICFNLQA